MAANVGRTSHLPQRARRCRRAIFRRRRVASIDAEDWLIGIVCLLNATSMDTLPCKECVKQFYFSQPGDAVESKASPTPAPPTSCGQLLHGAGHARVDLRTPVNDGSPVRILIGMDDREALEAEFVAEVLRIVGPGADPEGYAVAPNTSDELLKIRVQRLRELPSGIGHEELLRRVGPRDGN